MRQKPGVMARDGRPVHDIEEDRHDVSEYLPGSTRHCQQQGDDYQQCSEGRQESQGAPPIEAAEAHPPESSLFLEQQGRDQEPRKHEEDRDAELAGTGRNPDARVVGEHEEDGEAPEPIQPGPMPQPPARVRRPGEGVRTILLYHSSQAVAVRPPRVPIAQAMPYNRATSSRSAW